MNELRFGPDRRRFARGGRRTIDPAGYAPMVVVIDNDATRLDVAEAILAIAKLPPRAAVPELQLMPTYL